MASLLQDLFVPGESLHERWPRFGAAFSGSLVLHLAMVLRQATQLVFNPTWQLAIVTGAVILVLSAIYGLLISLAVAKGSLVRHYLYGVFLPVLTYLLSSQAARALFTAVN